MPPAPRSQALPCLVLLLLLGTEAGDPAKCAPPLTALPAPQGRPSLGPSSVHGPQPDVVTWRFLWAPASLLPSYSLLVVTWRRWRAGVSSLQLWWTPCPPGEPCCHPDRVLGSPTLGHAAARPGSLRAPAGAGPRQPTPGPPAGAGCANLGRHSLRQARGGNRARSVVGHSERVPERQRLVPALRAAGTLCNRDLTSQFQQLWTGFRAAREKITASSCTEKVD